MKNKSWIAILLITIIILLVPLIVNRNSEDFDLSIGPERHYEDVEIIKMRFPRRSISDQIAGLRESQKILKGLDDPVVKKAVSDALFEIEIAWDEFQEVLADSETRYGHVKSVDFTGSKKHKTLAEPYPIAKNVRGNTEYAYSSVNEDGTFCEAVKLVYLDEDFTKIDNAKSFRISFHKESGFVTSFKKYDSSLFVIFNSISQQIILLRNVSSGQEFSYSWNQDGAINVKSVIDLKDKHRKIRPIGSIDEVPQDVKDMMVWPFQD